MFPNSNPVVLVATLVLRPVVVGGSRSGNAQPSHGLLNLLDAQTPDLVQIGVGAGSRQGRLAR